jgi:23S rRNA (guanosine2251-2'-O)-methyltransferase
MLEKEKQKKPEDVTLFLKNTEAEKSLVVLLDKITDPQNFGAILRSCDQFSVDCVIIPSRKSVTKNRTVLSASAGASTHVQVFTVSNLCSAMEMLKQKGFWIYGAHIEGKAIDTIGFNKKVAIVLGSEGEGLSTLVKKRCDELFRIPTKGHIDSLNVSVAAGIILYEIRRQVRF